MIYLALDTANHLCAAAIYDDDNQSILGEITEDIGRGHAERLMDVISDCFSRTELEYCDLDKIICTTGPGSFTGVRVGLATARGLGLGLSLPVTGISTLDALQHEANATGPLATILDARRGEAYVQWRGNSDAPFSSPSVIAYEVLAEHLEGKTFDICGSGAAELQTHMQTPHEVLHELSSASIATIARLGAEMNGKLAPPEPNYLRAPDAKPQKLPVFAPGQDT